LKSENIESEFFRLTTALSAIKIKYLSLLFFADSSIAGEPQLQITTIKTKYLAPSYFADTVNVSQLNLLSDQVVS
jgi:hypothetical protein